MLDTILAYGKCILDFALLFWFTMQFFTLRWEKRRLVSWGLLLGLSTVQFLINLLYIPELNTMTALLCSLILNLMLFKGSIAARLLCSFFEVLLLLICESIHVLIYASMIRVNMIAVIDDTIKNAGFNLCSTGMFCVILLVVRYFHWLKQRKENTELTITENLSIITVPVVSIFIIYYVFNILGLNTKLGNRADSLSMIFFLGVLFMNLAVILGDNHWRKRCQLQHELDRLSRIEQLDRVVIGQQDAFIEELKGLAHDYTKQIDGIKHLLQEGAGGGEGELVERDIRSYADEMLHYIEDSYRFAFIPSPALRSILCQIQLCCDSAQIQFDTNILFSDFSFMAFPDIYTIFENPLENAVRACGEITDSSLARRIALTISRKKNLIWVEIKNTKTNPVRVKHGSIQTTKPDESKHGLGIKNMKRVVKKYGGYSHVEYTEEEFVVTMALPVSFPASGG